jgi:hypothetical protein
MEIQFRTDEGSYGLIHSKEDPEFITIHWDAQVPDRPVFLFGKKSFRRVFDKN